MLFDSVAIGIWSFALWSKTAGCHHSAKVSPFGPYCAWSRRQSTTFERPVMFMILNMTCAILRPSTHNAERHVWKEENVAPQTACEGAWQASDTSDLYSAFWDTQKCLKAAPLFIHSVGGPLDTKPPLPCRGQTDGRLFPWFCFSKKTVFSVLFLCFFSHLTDRGFLFIATCTPYLSVPQCLHTHAQRLVVLSSFCPSAAHRSTICPA